MKTLAIWTLLAMVCPMLVAGSQSSTNLIKEDNRLAPKEGDAYWRSKGTFENSLLSRTLHAIPVTLFGLTTNLNEMYATAVYIPLLVIYGLVLYLYDVTKNSALPAAAANGEQIDDMQERIDSIQAMEAKVDSITAILSQLVARQATLKRNDVEQHATASASSTQLTDKATPAESKVVAPVKGKSNLFKIIAAPTHVKSNRSTD